VTFKYQCLWPKELSELTPETAWEFIKHCRTWDEAGRQIRDFPDKDYLKEIAREWVHCRLTGTPLVIEKSRRLVTSWLLRSLELFDAGLQHGNQLLTHTKREDAAGHVWRIWFMYDDLATRFPSWKLPKATTYGNELTQTLDQVILPNGTRITQYFEKSEGLQGSGYSIVTMEELSVYRQPSGMYDQATRLVQSPPGMPNGLVCAVTNFKFSDSYEQVIAGASGSPY
jgi:hypothetical protein